MVKRIRVISVTTQKRILDFLQGAVYCWCGCQKDKLFHFRDLMALCEGDWNGTVLQDLYDANLEKIANDKNKPKEDKAVWKPAWEQSRHDVGCLLKLMLFNDKKDFNMQDGHGARQYGLRF